jgi:hypothetical protein
MTVPAPQEPRPPDTPAPVATLLDQESGGGAGRSQVVAITATGGALVLLVASPFLPLLLAGLEKILFGSDHVEDLFRTIGLHDDLSRLYDLIL